MKASNFFPSTYLKAADLNDRNVSVIMERVEHEDIGSEQKPILYFRGKDKGLVLNKTNNNNIISAYGDETDDWSGKELILFPVMVDFQGKTVPAIRVRAPAAKDRRAPAHAARKGYPANPAAIMDDDIGEEIPF